MGFLFAILALASNPAPAQPAITLPAIVITASAPRTAWMCSTPRELVQGSGTVRTCEVGK